MQNIVKKFLHRGLIFGGFGPIIAGIIYFILYYKIDNFLVTGKEMFMTIISTYILAFIHAGASVFNQIEKWPIMKSLLYHFLSLYIVYIICYLINSWIAFSLTAILIFTAAFVAIYFIIWIIVVVSIKTTEKRMNQKLQ